MVKMFAGVNSSVFYVTVGGSNKVFREDCWFGSSKGNEAESDVAGKSQGLLYWERIHFLTMLRHRDTFLLLILALLCVTTSLAQRKGGNKTPPRAPPPPAEDEDGGLTDECPEPNGYFADAVQCDKYYECIDGAITEKLCPDGMVFNDFSIKHEKCDLPFGIDCSQRPERQTPQPSLHCPRKNGYFAHEEANVCDKFYYCVDGKFNMITCPDGLVYSETTGICSWPDEAKKKGCSSQDVFQFQCPQVNDTFGQQHPRYADPDDCQFFYVCIDGKIPRRNGCKRGQVFDELKGQCLWPRHVPECKDWYKGIISDEELALLENPPPRPKPSEEAVRKRQGGKRKKPQQHLEDEE